MIHRRNILKTSIATFFGLSIGTSQAGLFSSPQCGTKCSYKSNRYSVGGPDKWGGPNTVDGHTHLQYYIWTRDRDLDTEVWDNEITNSYESWSKVTNLSFERIDNGKNADIIMGASGRWRHGFGRRGDTLAWAQLPYHSDFDGQLLTMFDKAEKWTIDSEERGILFRAVCAHEIGHLLGLDHSQHESALMYPYYHHNIETPQLIDDIPKIQQLYGELDSVCVEEPVPPMP